MSRYIDADLLIEAMGEEPYVLTDSDDEIAERNQWLTDMHIIETAPTIDIVRCKECRHCKKFYGTFRDKPITYYHCNEHSRDVESDDFCSWGERKSE